MLTSSWIDTLLGPSTPRCYKCRTTEGLTPLKQQSHPDRTHICGTCMLENLEQGIGMKLAPVGDGCEWNPGADRPARNGDAHTSTTPATVILGAHGNWRLCALCAALPRFRRYRVRKPIVKKGTTS